MKCSAVYREAWRNIVSGTTGTVAYGALLSIIIAGLTLLDLSMVAGLNRQAQEFRASMSTLTVLQSVESIDGAACESLNRLPGIHAAAVRKAAPPLIIASLPGSTTQTYEATASIGQVLRSNVGATSGVYLSEQLATTIQASAGEPILFTAGPSIVGGVFAWDETDGRRAGYASSVFVPSTSERPFDECWVDAWPVSEHTHSMLPLTKIPGTGAESLTYQMNTTRGTTFDGNELFRERPTRYTALAIAAASLALGYVSVTRRRLELAANLHAGVMRSDQLMIQLLEYASWAAPALITQCCLTAFAVFDSLPDDRQAMTTISAAYTMTGIAFAWIGILTGSFLARENHLQRYAKNQ